MLSNKLSCLLAATTIVAVHIRWLVVTQVSKVFKN